MYVMDFRTKTVVPYVFKPENFTLTRLDHLEKIQDFPQFQAGYTFEQPGIYFTKPSEGEGEFDQKTDFFFIVLRPKSVFLGMGMIPLETVSFDEFLTFYGKKYEEDKTKFQFGNAIGLNPNDKSSSTEFNLMATTKMVLSNWEIIEHMKTAYPKVFQFPSIESFDPANLDSSMDTQYQNFIDFYMLRTVQGELTSRTAFEDNRSEVRSVFIPMMNNFKEITTVKSIIESTNYTPQLPFDQFTEYLFKSIELEDINLVFDCIFETFYRRSQDVINFETNKKPNNTLKGQMIYTYKSIYYKLIENVYNYVFKLKNFPVPNNYDQYHGIASEQIQNFMSKFPAYAKYQKKMNEEIALQMNKFHHGLILEILFYFKKLESNIKDFIMTYIPLAYQVKQSASKTCNQKTFDDVGILSRDQILYYLHYTSIPAAFSENCDPHQGQVNIFSWTENRRILI